MPLLEEEEVLTEDRGGQGVVEEEGVNSVVAAWVEVPRTYLFRELLFTMTMEIGQLAHKEALFLADRWAPELLCCVGRRDFWTERF